MLYNRYSSEVLYIAKKAAEIIMSFYSGKVEAIYKADNSPVTQADFQANKFIVNALKQLTPDIGVVSEENSESDNKQAAKKVFWLVDPLDGTKSYIKKTGEFTVNIALIENNVPTGGVVYIPAKEIGYFTAEDGNAYKQISNNLPDLINARVKPDTNSQNQQTNEDKESNNKIVVVASKSHMTAETEDYIKNLGDNISLISAASSLKFCLLAEGKADLYPRFGNTYEWDTGAGHAVLNAAGGSMLNIDGSDFFYAKPDFLNPYFIASGRM